MLVCAGCCFLRSGGGSLSGEGDLPKVKTEWVKKPRSPGLPLLVHLLTVPPLDPHETSLLEPGGRPTFWL